MTLKIILVSVVCFVIVQRVKCLDVGNSCQLEDGISGVCLPLPQCQKAMDDLKALKSLTICGFRGLHTIVCCPKDENTESKKAIERISQRKCKEYSDCKILYPDRVTRSMRSTEVALTEFPHLAAVAWIRRDNGKFIFKCEGSLVSENFVLTAAHCVNLPDERTTKPEPSSVRLGELNVVAPVGNHVQDINIVEIIVHSSYNPPSRYHNIALLKLETSIKRGPIVNPICLWQSRYIPNNNSTVAGWGKLDFFEGTSNTLRKADVSIIDNIQCARLYPRNSTVFPEGIISEQVCAGHPENSKYNCQGENGGPLIIYNPDHLCSHYLIGITASGSGCLGEKSPAVYTRISSYIEWIESNVWL